MAEESGESGGFPMGPTLQETTEERCRSLCRKYDSRAVGTDAVEAGCEPDFFTPRGDNDYCRDLCEFLGPVSMGDPLYGQLGGCAEALGDMVDCAYPCADPADGSCFVRTCEDVTPCGAEAAETSCEPLLSSFYDMKGIDPSQAPMQSPLVLCGEICERREAAGCDVGLCGEACALVFGPGVSDACSDAYVAEAECALALDDACDESPCGDLLAMRMDACGF